MVAAVLAIVLVAPFERVVADLPGGFTLTTVEIVVLGALASVAWRHGVRAFLPVPLPRGLVVAGLVFGVVIALAALTSSVERGNALRFVARMATSAAVFCLTLQAIDSRARARLVAVSIVGVAVVVSLVALLELFEIPAVMHALTVFRPGFHVVGGQIRATGPLAYPTIASMYLELAFVAGLWLLLDPLQRFPRGGAPLWSVRRGLRGRLTTGRGGDAGGPGSADRRRVSRLFLGLGRLRVAPAHRDQARLSAGAGCGREAARPGEGPRRPASRSMQAVMLAVLAIVGAGITATFTRAGLLAMGMSLVVLAALRLGRAVVLVRHRVAEGAGERAAVARDVRVLALLGALLAVIVVASRSPQVLAVRMTTEGTRAWYGATYDVPASVQLRAGETREVVVGLANTGRLTWDSHGEPPFALAYHWIDAATARVVEFEGARTWFPRPVAPGERVRLAATVVAPRAPGRYTLVWDVVHETRAWLSTEAVVPGRTDATVIGPPAGGVQERMERLPPAASRPSRPELWRAALAIAAEHPWRGVGPDNFRRVYGAYVDSARWDARVHANSMYLELLSGAGVPGLAALLGVLGTAGVVLWRRARLSVHAPPGIHAAAAAGVAWWLVVAGHGLVDAFLSFTPIYVMLAVTGGLMLSRGVLADEACDAHRV